MASGTQPLFLLDHRVTEESVDQVVDPPRLIKGSSPSYGCGQCRTVLFAGLAARDAIRGAVRCPKCGAINSTQVVAVDRDRPDLAARLQTPRQLPARTPIRNLELVSLPPGF
jgi:DNA-directed RNA polymerase subunit RPC12/RpoP